MQYLLIIGLLFYVLSGHGCQMPEQTGTRTKSGYSDRESFDREMSDLHRQAIRDRVRQRNDAEYKARQMMTDLGMQMFLERMNKPGGQRLP